MDNYTNNSINLKNTKSLILKYSLLTIVFLIGLTTLVGLFVAIYAISHETATAWVIPAVIIAGLVILGLLSCGLIVAIMAFIKKLDLLGDHTHSLDQRTAILAEQSVARSHADSSRSPANYHATEILTMLGEIRDVLLLPDQERRHRYQQMMEDEFQKRKEAVEHLAHSFDFHRARDEMAAFIKRFGTDERIRELQNRIEEMAEAARVNDIKEVTKKVENMMGLTYWDDAESLTRELARKYPAASEPVALLDRVRRERQLFEQNHRQRMHDEIQQFVNMRQWRKALEAGLRFINTFPTGPDTDVLRQQIATLEANADIQARQELEKQIKELIQQNQYWDALELARRIIADYPLSPQANALRGQLPRLEELARKQGPKT